MRCEQASELLALWAGDDLDARESSALENHLTACADCQEKARVWRADLAALRGELRDEVLGGPSAAELDRAVAAAGDIRGQTGRRASWRRLPVAVAAVIVFLLIGRFWVSDLAEDEGGVPGVRDQTVAWSEMQEFFDDCLTTPVPLGSWQAVEGAGVLTVLIHLPGQNRYQIVECVEAPNLARLGSYPWLAQRLQKWRLDAGADGNLVVSVCGTGDLDRASRRRLQKEFRAEFVNDWVN